jgi:serine/threonine protein kinase
MSPEYATLGQLTPKADVYSFGILLLEIVSGRKNIDTTLESEKVYLVKWVCMFNSILIVCISILFSGLKSISFPFCDWWTQSLYLFI